MTIPEGYIRVSSRRRCPICGRRDWCLVATDGSSAICPRTVSDREYGEAGFWHAVGGEIATQMRANPPCPEPPPPSIDAAGIAREFSDCIWEPALESHAVQLGLSAESLTRLGIGWSDQHCAWSFPMRDGHGRIIGIRLRNSQGDKWAVRGSLNGLFFAPELLHGAKTVLLTEGPTDTAAAMDLGFVACGRHTARGGTALILELLNVSKPDQVVIVGDVDVPDQLGRQAGIEGAFDLADRIWSVSQWQTVVVFPRREKDLRAWVLAGATRAEMQAVIANARPWVRRAAA